MTKTETTKMVTAVKFNADAEDTDLIVKIAQRVASLHPEFDVIKVSLDLESTHCNGHLLNLKKLLEFEDDNFWYDIYGILSHVDRKTGKLKDCFLPKCSR